MTAEPNANYIEHCHWLLALPPSVTATHSLSSHSGRVILSGYANCDRRAERELYRTLSLAACASAKQTISNTVIGCLRFRVHETLQTRDDRGEFHTLVRELHSYDDRFFEYFRMSQAQFAHILSILKPSITKQTTKFRQPIGCPEKLANSPTFCFLVS